VSPENGPKYLGRSGPYLQIHRTRKQSVEDHKSKAQQSKGAVPSNKEKQELKPKYQTQHHQQSQQQQQQQRPNINEGKKTTHTIKNPRKKTPPNLPKRFFQSLTDQMLPELLDLLPRICTRASLLPTLLANSDTCFKTVCPANAVEAHAVAVAIMPQNDLQQ